MLTLVCLVTRQQLLNHPPEDYAAAFDEDHHHSNECVSLHDNINSLVFIGLDIKQSPNAHVCYIMYYTHHFSLAMPHIV